MDKDMPTDMALKLLNNDRVWDAIRVGMKLFFANGLTQLLVLF